MQVTTKTNKKVLKMSPFKLAEIVIWMYNTNLLPKL